MCRLYTFYFIGHDALNTGAGGDAVLGRQTPAKGTNPLLAAALCALSRDLAGEQFRGETSASALGPFVLGSV